MNNKGSSGGDAQPKEDALGLVRRSFEPRAPMPDIVTFATDPSYLGLTLYPKQKLILTSSSTSMSTA